MVVGSSSNKQQVERRSMVDLPAPLLPPPSNHRHRHCLHHLQYCRLHGWHQQQQQEDRLLLPSSPRITATTILIIAS
jgi:hypothetical protein